MNRTFHRIGADVGTHGFTSLLGGTLKMSLSSKAALTPWRISSYLAVGYAGVALLSAFMFQTDAGTTFVEMALLNTKLIVWPFAVVGYPLVFRMLGAFVA